MSKDAAPHATPDDPFRIAFFGDSICFGEGVSLHKGWVSRLSAMIGDSSLGGAHDIEVANFGVNGNTTRLALERMPYDIQSRHPEILIVQFGMNDCNHWETDRGVPRVSPSGFRANLEEIVTRGLTFGALKVFLHTNHPTTRDYLLAGSDVTYEQNNERYNGIIREVAAAMGPSVALTDIELVWNEHVAGDRVDLDELLLPDKLHLSESGHDLYFDTVAPIVMAAASQLLGTPVAAS